MQNTLKKHKHEAEQLITVELAKEDFDAWIAAQSVADFGRRIHAIESYLNGTTQLGYKQDAIAKIRETLDILNRSDDSILLKTDPDILIRLAPATLKRAGPDVLQRLEALPLERLETLDPEVIIRFPPSLAAQLPLYVRGRLERQPSWANDTGVDQWSPWARVSTGPLSLTMRPVLMQRADGKERWLWVSETEITQAQWRSVLPKRRDNKFEFVGDTYPAHSISWDQTQQFLGELATIENAPALRLPTQSEMTFLLSTNDRTQGGWKRNAITDLATPSAKSISDISANVSNSQNTLQKVLACLRYCRFIWKCGGMGQQ